MLRYLWVVLDYKRSVLVMPPSDPRFAELYVFGRLNSLPFWWRVFSHLPFKKIVVSLAYLSAMSAVPAAAFDPSHVQRLRETGACTRCDLSRAELPGVDLSGAELAEANLAGANLQGADLSGSNLRGADLSSANLMSAIIMNATLQQAKLVTADLRCAVLEGTNLDQADMRGANFCRTETRNCSMTREDC